MSNFTFQYSPKLDGAFLKSVYEDDLDIAIINFDEFLKMLPQQLHEMQQSFEEGNINGFRMTIHKVKPTFSYVGLTAISAKADVLEQMCLTIKSIREIDNKYVDFKTCLHQLIPVVQEELVRMKT